jgi:hypothetical protein
MGQGKPGTRFIGVELDSISGRIARALHPEHNIRIESFSDTKPPEDRIDAVIGNVPFADLKLDYLGQKLSLHDYFFAKSIDALKPGGVLALVTSHYMLDKQNAAPPLGLSGRASSGTRRRGLGSGPWDSTAKSRATPPRRKCHWTRGPIPRRRSWTYSLNPRRT